MPDFGSDQSIAPSRRNAPTEIKMKVADAIDRDRHDAARRPVGRIADSEPRQRPPAMAGERRSWRPAEPERGTGQGRREEQRPGAEKRYGVCNHPHGAQQQE